ncbi:hypothetical protein PR202_ga02216 [Eleusine coracana subsp. coracana]|uniref:Thioesterase domain-containing protein n=1 Tax=Eleusine coracana subsp. coracana TaxID=191504 RepID=A0AAV5BL52_ELECO|nr:hypothetical protein PR202_ga02216 [Eleusine coracana subsp. coracana]
MAFSMQQLFNLPPPPSSCHPPAPSKARARSSHRAVLLGELLPCCRSRALPVQHVSAFNSSRAFEEAICTRKNTIMPIMSQSKFFEVEMTVRDYELDQYGVVNDAMYASYIEKAREEMFESFGVRMGYIARTGRAMAVAEFNFKYLAPLKRGAKFVVMTRVAQIKGVRMLLEYFVETSPERKLGRAVEPIDSKKLLII